MAIATVTKVSLGISKTFKSGKTFEGAELCFLTEKGGTKKEFIFARAPYMGVVKQLEAGDKIDATYTKDGEYFNLTDVKLIEKGAGVAPTKPSSSGGGGGGGYQEAPEKQASIQRQNALTNALSFTNLLIQQGAFKKTTTPDILLSETLRYAKEFAAFNAGTLQTEELKADLSSVVVESDCPFEDDELDM